MAYDIPILIIAFNRPDVSKQTFERIRQLKPSFLYVAIDGARDNVIGEVDQVEQVLSIYRDIDWPCSAKYKHNEKNLGAEVSVSGAVSWVLSEHDYCIVLEDDILATKAFFDFARQMLIRYKDAGNVYQISAAQFTPMDTMKTDYVFSLYGHTGFGWATWKRAWSHFSLSLHDFDSTICNKTIKENYSCKQAYNSFIRSVKKMKNRGSEYCSWDRCWSYVRNRDGGLSVVPRSNLNQNIGMWGLHANGLADYHKFEGDNAFKVISHPSAVIIDKAYDKYHYWKYLHYSLLDKVKNKLKSIF